MPTRLALLLLGAALGPSALAMAQRAAFTGTVQDPDGAPLAGAQVACAIAAEVLSPATAERLTATTDAAGRFAIDLVPGRAYAVWAIGPLRREARLVVPPQFIAAAGRTTVLEAVPATWPQRLVVAGTADWLACGPLALRLFVADGVPLGPRDLPIPGDGPIPLPPLPTDQFTAALVDGQGEPLAACQVDLRADPTAQFPGARTVELTVAAGGQPVAGAELRVPWSLPIRHVHAIDSRALVLAAPRLAGRTDAAGRATVHVPCGEQVDTALLAHAPGWEGAMAAWAGDARLVPPEGAGPGLHLELPARAPTRLPVCGGTAADRLTATSFHWISILSRAGQRDARLSRWQVPLPMAADADGARFTCSGPLRRGGAGPMQLAGGIGAWLGGSREGPVPQRTAAITFADQPELPAIDLATLGTFAVRVVDGAGAAVPCAHLAVAGMGMPLTWWLRLVTNPAGEAVLRLPAGQEFLFHAVTETAAGVAAHAAGPGEVALTIVLEDLVPTAIRVVDANDQPVAGASLAQLRTATTAGPPLQLLWNRLLTGSVDGQQIHVPRTDARGEVRVRLNRRGEPVLQARRGLLQSEPQQVRPGQSSTLRLSPP